MRQHFCDIFDMGIFMYWFDFRLTSGVYYLIWTWIREVQFQNIRICSQGLLFYGTCGDDPCLWVACDWAVVSQRLFKNKRAHLIKAPAMFYTGGSLFYDNTNWRCRSINTGIQTLLFPSESMSLLACSLTWPAIRTRLLITVRILRRFTFRFVLGAFPLDDKPGTVLDKDAEVFGRIVSGIHTD